MWIVRRSFLTGSTLCRRGITPSELVSRYHSKAARDDGEETGLVGKRRKANSRTRKNIEDNSIPKHGIKLDSHGVSISEENESKFSVFTVGLGKFKGEYIQDVDQEEDDVDYIEDSDEEESDGDYIEEVDREDADTRDGGTEGYDSESNCENSDIVCLGQDDPRTEIPPAKFNLIATRSFHRKLLVAIDQDVGLFEASNTRAEATAELLKPGLAREMVKLDSCSVLYMYRASDIPRSISRLLHCHSRKGSDGGSNDGSKYERFWKSGIEMISQRYLDGIGFNEVDEVCLLATQNIIAGFVF